MRVSHKLLATGAVLAAALTSVLAGNSADQPALTQPPATQPATQPTTRPSSVAFFPGQNPGDWTSYQAMHAYILDRFIRSDGFGVERVPRVQDEPRRKRLYADGTRYIVGRVQLISLNDGKDPFAYVTSFADAMKNEINGAKRVPLDDPAARALDELKQGKEVILTGTGDGRELIGAIRATSDCTKCHMVSEGTLLGAFRYPLVKPPADDQRQSMR